MEPILPRPNPGPQPQDPPTPVQPEVVLPQPLTPPQPQPILISTPDSPDADTPAPIATPEPVASPEPEPTPAPSPEPEPAPDPEPAPAPAPEPVQPVFTPAPVFSSATPTKEPEATHSSDAPAVEHVSNPFFAATNGLADMLKLNASPILLIVVAMLVLILGFYGLALLLLGFTFGSIMSGGEAPGFGPVLFLGSIVGWLVIIYLLGTLYAIAGSSAYNKKVTLKESFKTAGSRFLPLLGLALLTTLVVVVGLILLIIPGIYLANRLALAPLVFYAENLGVIASMKRSMALTKGHFLEILGAQLAGSLLIGGNGALLTPASMVAPLTNRYQSLKAIKDSGLPKPKLHWWNILLPLLVLVIIGAYFALIGMGVFSGIQDKANESAEQTIIDNQTNSFPAYDFDMETPQDTMIDPNTPTTDSIYDVELPQTQ